MKCALVSVCAALAFGCGAADRELSPNDLELRDLLGVSVDVARAWSAAERADARALVEAGLALPTAAEMVSITDVFDDRAVVGAMIRLDDQRFDRGEPVIAVAYGSVELDVMELVPVPAVVALEGGGGAGFAIAGWTEDDRDLPLRATDLIAELAEQAGAPQEPPVVVAPAHRAPFVALYLADRNRLLINPVVLAIVESDVDVSTPSPTAGAAAGAQPSQSPHVPGAGRAQPTSGNPYSFFGSVAECAAFEQLRCEACIAAGSCAQESRDAASGLAECETLSEDNGVGYHLFCVNLALAIETVADCASVDASGCGQVNTASNQVSALAANRIFIDDPMCQAGLDQCLASIYGDSDGDFPGPPNDAGPPPPPPPPRDTEIGCGNQDCSFDPQCNASCDGPECGQLVSCQADCGGDDGCGSCENEDGGGCESGGGSSGGGGSCDSSSDSGGGGCEGDGCNSTCNGEDCDSSDGGGGCGGGSDGGGGCGGGDGGGGCGGGSDGGGSCGGGGGGGGGNCAVARSPRGSHKAVASVVWGGLPLAFLLMFGWRRRVDGIVDPDAAGDADAEDDAEEPS